MNLTKPWPTREDVNVDGVASRWEELRRTLTEEADRLVQVASKMSREAGTRASDVTADAATTESQRTARTTGRLGDFVSELLKAVIAAGTALALSGRQTIARDLRKVRPANAPAQTRRDFRPGISFLAGFGAGLAAMYFFDPDEGRRRRNMIRDRLTALARRTRQGEVQDVRPAVDDMADTQPAAARQMSASAGSSAG